jgi:RimJ/RimL family protein N-acetyltransferase/uncharacterized glyoxalase superfamily protein PhnB
VNDPADPRASTAPALETARLRLDALTPGDAEALHAFYRDPEAMRYMPEPPHADLARTRARIARDLATMRRHLWAVRLRDGGDLVGVVGYLAGTRHPGLGYLIHPAHWGRGYAGEAVAAALEHGFDVLGFDRVELWIDERNRASRRVAEKLGFRQRSSLQQRYAHRDEAHTMLVYGILVEAYRGEPIPIRPNVHAAEPVLMVHDVAAAVVFYRDRLGFGVDFVFGDGPDGPDHAGVSLGDWSGAMATLQLTRVPREREIRPAGYLYLLVGHGLDDLYERVRRAGVEIAGEPETFPWGMREFGVKDPEGHVLRFGQPT